jgi:hypothetical protein
MIRNEIDRLNREIDLRIIKGLSYKRESLRHKFLMNQLSRLSNASRSWFGRSLSFMSAFMF